MMPEIIHVDRISYTEVHINWTMFETDEGIDQFRVS